MYFSQGEMPKICVLENKRSRYPVLFVPGFDTKINSETITTYKVEGNKIIPVSVTSDKDEIENYFYRIIRRCRHFRT